MIKSPIIPVSCLPSVKAAIMRGDQKKLAFVVQAVVALWEDAKLDIPEKYEDLYLSLQGAYATINARAQGGVKGGKPSVNLAKPSVNLAKPSGNLTPPVDVGVDVDEDIPPLSPKGDIPPTGVSVRKRTQARVSDNLYTEEFERFWTAYPRKTAKGAAAAAYAKARKAATFPGIEAIEKTLRQFSWTEQWKRDGGQFIPHPTTWLNQQRWLDEIPPEDREEVERMERDNAPLPVFNMH